MCSFVCVFKAIVCVKVITRTSIRHNNGRKVMQTKEESQWSFDEAVL